MKVLCTECNKIVEARLTNGEEIYPHRPDLYQLPFWKCDTCGNYVGCHHKSDTPTKPLGHIVGKELKQIKIKIHAILDPLWKSGKIQRKHLYARLSKELGYTYHTGEIKSLEDGLKILKYIQSPELLAPKEELKKL